VSIAFGIQHEKRMRHMTRTLLSVTCLALPYFLVLSNKGTIFERKSY